MASPNSFRDPYWADLASKAEQKYDITPGLLVSVLTNGERSNANQVSEAKAKTVFQIIPETRDKILKRDGIDAYLNDQNAAEAAALVLKDGVNWAKGRAKDPMEVDRLASGFYHAGGDTENWGPKTNAYINRVMVGQQGAKVNALENGFAKFMASNPAVPAGQSSAAIPAAATPAEKKADPLAAGFGDWLAKETSGKVSIPGAEGYDARPPTPDATLGEQIVGAGETALNVGTGLVGGTVGATIGAGAELANQLTNPAAGANPMQAMSDAAAKGAEALTYAPRTSAGQDMAAATGNALANTVPLAGLSGEMASLARAGQIAKPTAAVIPAVARDAVGTAAENVAAGVRSIPERVGQMVGREPAAPVVQPGPGVGRPMMWRNADTDVPVTFKGVEPTPGSDGRTYARVEVNGRESFVPLDELVGAQTTPGTFGSVGSAGVDMATQRRMAAQELPVPIDLTKGQATRDFAAQRFEGETAKNPEAGAPIRERFTQQNKQIVQNIDAMLDMTGAEAPDLRSVGIKVDAALRKQMDRDKAEVGVAYKNAEKAGELESPVSTQGVIDLLNESAAAEGTAKVLGAAKKEIQRLGGATVDDAGNLVPAEMSLKNMEQLRKFINSNMEQVGPDTFYGPQIKSAIDTATEGAGGQLYREARAKRARVAQNYEDRAVINRLLSEKPGTSDRRVAFEDVFKHTMLDGSLDDVRNVRRVLQRSGDEGQQAWKELQGQTVSYLREEATKNVARDQAGNPIVSAAGLDRAVKRLDSDGKLDFVFGKKGAEQIRTLNDVTNHIKTVAPGTVNTSNTASVILAAMDMAISGAGGMPLPVMSGLRLAVNNVKDRRLRMRVSEALGDAMRKERAQPKPIEGIDKKKTIH